LETTLINNSFASNPAVNASSAVHSTPYTFPKEHDLATLPIKMEVKDLSIYYNKFKAVEGISLAFPANQITAIIGPSGCGKSTLLRSLNRMTELIPGRTWKDQFFWTEKIFTLPVRMLSNCAGASEWSSSVPTPSP
jgi:ABC-type glutathione transport system ATPase component